MVVVSESWMKNTQYANYVEMNTAKAVLSSRPNSHPFQERTLSLDQPVKVGRSVARSRATATNAIFDCKVLSRHHAVLWYEDGKFFLQDTKSSNGTFVNNNRLSTNESEPHEVSSGDIVQFGVDVVENNRKVTHGCIVAVLKLYLPDGKEAKASPSIIESNRHGMVPLDDLYKLNQVIQEASQRELSLETKLTALQHVVDAARRATDDSWQAYVGEERLLSRVAALETQLTQAGKNFGEDRLREELKQMHDDRAVYQLAAKEALMKSQTERLEAVAAAAEQERARASAENEVALAKENWERAEQELQELAHKLSEEQRKTNEERENYEQKLKELQAHITELQANVVVKKEAKEEEEEVPEDGESDHVEEIRKFDVILNDVKLLHDENDTCNDINIKNENEKEVSEIILTAVENKCDAPILNDNLLPRDADSTETLVENKDELTTSKEVSINNDTSSDTDTEEPSDISEIEVPVRDVPPPDTKTLKNNHQTVSEQKRHIEQLEVLTASNITRIALLEKSLINEKEEKTYLSKQASMMREEYTALETKHIQCLAESKELRNQLHNLELQVQQQPQLPPLPEPARAPLATEERACQWEPEGDACGDVCGEYDVQQKLAATPGAPPQPAAAEVPNKQLLKLEEEIVLLKERFARVSEERQALSRELVGAHEKYNALCNRSHNTLFFYVAPLALMVLYLLVSSMFS